MLLLRRSFHLVVWISLFSFPLSLFAQIPNATDTTATPAPGMHDYLSSPVETVNPANGSLSVRIPVRMAQGRQFTLPFSFAYGSNGAFYIGQPTRGGAPRYNTTPTVIGSKSGWSYSYPVVSFFGGTWTIPGSLDHLITCHGSTNYVFQDPNGNRHNLALSVSPNVASPDGFDNCNQGLQGDGEFTTGGEGPILATTSIPTVDNGTFPGVTIVDGGGSGYNLPGGSPGTTGITTLATSVTDRNGNAVTIANSSGAVTYTDTVGRTALSTSGMGGNPDTITVAGLSSPYHVYWTTASASFTDNMLNLCTGAGCVACPTSLSASSNVVSSIVLPNGRQFTLTYDTTYGMLTKIVYPSGGYVRYVWGLNPQAEVGAWSYAANGTLYFWDCRYDFPAVIDRYVSYDGSTEVLHQHFAYSTNWPNSTSYSWNSKTTTVTTTDLLRTTSFTTQYTYSPLGVDYVPNCGSCYLTQQVPVEQTIQYNDTNGSLLKTVSKTWQNIRLLNTQETTLPNGQASETAWSYNGNEMQIEQDDYDFGTTAPPSPPGPLLRATVTNYATFGTNHIVDKPSSVIVYSDAGKTNRVAETDYTYDNPVGTTTSGIVNHSGGCNCGNLTKQSRWVNGSGTTLNTSFTNDDTGQRLSMTDPKGNQTTYSYADNYSSGTPPGPTDAYLTNVTHPNTGVAHVEKFAYAYPSGEVTSFTDQNNHVTTYQYVDSLARLTETDFADGGITTNTYNDTPLSVSVETNRKIDTRWTDSFVLYDGLMQPIATSSANGEATPWDRIDTCYDGRGLVKFHSYPYQTNSAAAAPNCTSGTGDSFTFDALGRSTQVSHSDGNTILTSYTGRATQVQDEGNGTARVQRISQVDGLGRLAYLCEITSTTLIGITPTPAACGLDIAATGFLTSHAYTTLGDLLSVSQGGLNQRTFAYDFLSRLTTATNPESGTIQYTYDSDSNCPAPNSFSADLVSRVDARGIRTCMQYDPLHRVTQKNYSDGTPTATYNYDQSSANGVTLTNTIGRNSSQSTAGSFPTGSVFSYDTAGRIIDNSQCTPQNCGTGVFAFQYSQYDFIGDLLSATNSVGVTFNYSYNVVTRLTTMTTNFVDGSHPGTLFSNAHYGPFGMTGVTVGNGITESLTYTTRGWLQSLTANSGSTTLYSFNIATFAPNGDILAANDSVNGNWTYTYDPSNRLLSSNATGQAYTYDYDRFGNRWHQNGPQSSQLGFDANNRITGVTGVAYDTSGDLTSDGSGTGTHQYFYDAESRIIQVDGTLGNCSTATACYVYNAEGGRVRKTTSSGSVDYLYDLAGHQVAEVGPGGVFNRGELYAGNRHLATYTAGANGSTFFTHADWLGTERARTDMTAAACETITSLPFGDGQSITGSCGDVSPMHFTGKERDSESGLDDFGDRYYSSPMGRFTSVDPIWVKIDRIVDPQRLNLYAYGRNNPLLFVDPDGRDVTIGRCSIGSAQDCFNQLQAGLTKQDREHVKLVTGDDKNGCAKGVSCVTVDADYKSDSKNFQVLQTLANDHSATATVDVLKPNDSFEMKTTISWTKKDGDVVGIRSTTPGFDGYTFFPYKQGDSGPFSPDDITHAVINSEPLDHDIPATIHHEMRHIFLGDFGRSAKKAGHGQPGVDQQTKAAEAEAKKNEKQN